MHIKTPVNFVLISDLIRNMSVKISIEILCNFVRC